MKTTAYWSYKTCVKDRLRALRRERGALTQSYIADRLGVQASYLSRVLNSEKAHFSEDQLYRLLEALRFTEGEREYLFLLRSHAMTGLPERKAELERQIRRAQAAGKASELTDLASALSAALKEISIGTRE
ncbi:MAG: helix-turn-helix domain-containing protein [Bdellovibrionales bacterium]|nr:helix-turn-helix domain-containing protein [Bdellovibrionales bacterium]